MVNLPRYVRFLFLGFWCKVKRYMCDLYEVDFLQLLQLLPGIPP